jgi:NAD(P)-dependent dehydrogenase (short-subunit alcohol dehydrogenase family)
MNSSSITGRIALVTGANRGIVLDIAPPFALTLRLRP